VLVDERSAVYPVAMLCTVHPSELPSSVYYELAGVPQTQPLGDGFERSSVSGEVNPAATALSQLGLYGRQ
jgi:hypothetical protein